MATVIGIVLSVIGLILFLFFADVFKDRLDLSNQTLDQKFQVVVKMLNNYAYNGMGDITRVDKREFNIYQTGQNQMISFFYGTGHLTIKWKYKYFQKEVVFEKTFDNVREISDDVQQRIGEVMIKQMEQVVEDHKQKVTSGIF